jgi:4-hydroxybenzoate polyprenyltransferase
MAVINLLRLKHWIKNSFLFIPVFFAGELFTTPHYSRLILGFFAFSFIASAIYIINDYKDIEADRNHPEKKSRPLASGAVSVRGALIVFFILVIVSLTLALFLSKLFLIIILAYFILNIFYSLGLKKISILDIFIVASGFLFRVLGGGILAEVHISQWLIIMVFLLAVFLGLAKRRDDILLFVTSGKVIRESSKHYNLDFINAGLTMLSAVIVVAYLMYSISEEVTQRFNTEYVYGTSIFVIAAMLRYIQIALVENNTGSPTQLLYSDAFLKVTIVGWIVSFYIIIYFHSF